MNESRICILILNWNGADDTLECLTSLEKVTYDQVTSVVVDNGSTDDSVKRIKAKFPDRKIIELSDNLMYAGGNNAGLKWVAENDFEYVIFLNNDTIVETDFIEPLLAAFDSHKQVAISAPLMCYANRPDQVWYGGGRVNLTTGLIAHRYIRDSVGAIASKAVSTDYITGCCLMMPTQLALEFGGFDPAFKMYGEDVDLSLRCRAAGYQLIFVPESKIYHKVSASIGGEFSLSKMKRKLVGLIKLYSRHASWYQWLTILISQFFLSIKYLYIYLRYRSSQGTAKA